MEDNFDPLEVSMMWVYLELEEEILDNLGLRLTMSSPECHVVPLVSGWLVFRHIVLAA